LFTEQDLEVAMEACMQNGLALRFVAQPLRAHRDLVLVAVRVNKQTTIAEVHHV
jgi:hypothetical protein